VPQLATEKSALPVAPLTGNRAHKISMAGNYMLKKEPAGNIEDFFRLDLPFANMARNSPYLECLPARKPKTSTRLQLAIA
jgi:hypothetical protein